MESLITVGLLLEINRTCLTARKLKESDCEHTRFCCCISVNVCICKTLNLKIFQKRELIKSFLLSYSDSAPKNLRNDYFHKRKNFFLKFC